MPDPELMMSTLSVMHATMMSAGPADGGSPGGWQSAGCRMLRKERPSLAASDASTDCSDGPPSPRGSLVCHPGDGALSVVLAGLPPGFSPETLRQTLDIEGFAGTYLSIRMPASSGTWLYEVGSLKAMGACLEEAGLAVVEFAPPARACAAAIVRFGLPGLGAGGGPVSADWVESHPGLDALVQVSNVF